MVQTKVGHIVYCVDAANLPFYKDLLTFLGWSIWHENAEMLGVGAADGSSLWFGKVTKDVKNDYDGPGVNHLALQTVKQSEVDEAVAYLKKAGVPALFETPRHRPDFCSSESETYYQVMFESPDRILFEVVYIGPKE